MLVLVLKEKKTNWYLYHNDNEISPNTMVKLVASTKMAALMKATVKAEIQAVENNITMQMADMQGAIEQIRDKDMDVSSDHVR